MTRAQEPTRHQLKRRTLRFMRARSNLCLISSRLTLRAMMGCWGSLCQWSTLAMNVGAGTCACPTSDTLYSSTSERDRERPLVAIAAGQLRAERCSACLGRVSQGIRSEQSEANTRARDYLETWLCDEMSLQNNLCVVAVRTSFYNGAVGSGA